MPRHYTVTPVSRAVLNALARRCAAIRAANAEAEERRFYACLWAASVRELRRDGARS